MISSIRTGTFYWVLTGIFAALHLVLTMIPLFVLTGGQGFISMGLVSSVVIGFILGPIYGAISVFIGSGLGVLIFNIGGILGPFIPVVSPMMGSFVAGCLKTKQPKYVIGAFILGIAIYLVSPIGTILPIYIWMHTIGLMLSILFLFNKSSRWLYETLTFDKSHPEASILPLWLISFIPLLADNLFGSSLGAFWFAYVVGIEPLDLAVIFSTVILVYPFERIVVTFVITAVLMALERALIGTEMRFLLEETPKTIHHKLQLGNEAS